MVKIMKVLVNHESSGKSMVFEFMTKAIPLDEKEYTKCK